MFEAKRARLVFVRPYPKWLASASMPIMAVSAVKSHRVSAIALNVIKNGHLILRGKSSD